MWRVVYYGIFIAFIAPIEPWLDFTQGFFFGIDEAYYRPIKHGLLYVYAILLLAETIFRITHHSVQIAAKPALEWIRAAAAIALVIFGLFFIAIERSLIVHQAEPVDQNGHVQWFLVALAILTSVASFWIIDKPDKIPEKPLKRAKPKAVKDAKGAGP
jgi:hypothetical protein